MANYIRISVKMKQLSDNYVGYDYFVFVDVASIDGVFPHFRGNRMRCDTRNRSRAAHFAWACLSPDRAHLDGW
jgi:hypothetical protein